MTSGPPGPLPGPAADAARDPYAPVRTNGLATAALVCGLCGVILPLAPSIAAIILGVYARQQIRRTRDYGSGMALAGIIVGCVGIALWVFAVVVFLIVLSAIARQCKLGC
jgi:hypothetical protein